MRFLFLVAVALVSVTLGARVAFAHFGADAYILVPVDHVNPGESFEVIAADLTPNATVALTMTRDTSSISLGEAVSDAEGHFTTSLPLPADYPSGYAMLTAVAQDGTQASTWVLVGPRTSATPAPPGQPAWWADPSVIVLGVAVLGGVGALGYALIRRRQTQRVPLVTTGSGRRSAGSKSDRQTARRRRG